MSVLIDARVAAFGGLVDYEGGFSPASRDVPSAIADFRLHRGGRIGWLAGRFLSPASGLDDLATNLRSSLSPGEEQWEVAVAFDASPAASAHAVREFEARIGSSAPVVSIEATLPQQATPEDVASLWEAGTSANETATVFLEVQLPKDWEDSVPRTIGLIDTARTKTDRMGGAKLRCGGSEPSDFPSSGQIAHFMCSCRKAAIPFKLTAGLHRPIRHRDPGLGVMRHGFVNVLVASLLAHVGAPGLDVRDALDETDPAAFSIGASELRWRTRRFSTDAVIAARSHALIACESSELGEPIEALDDMRFLPPGGG